MPRAFQHIFSGIEAARKEDPATHFLVRASYLELYTNELTDLLVERDLRYLCVCVLSIYV
jgi:hypothetical protein